MLRVLFWVVTGALLVACSGNVIVDGATGTGASGTTTSPACPSGPGVTCELNAGMPGHVCVHLCASGVTTCPTGTTVTACPATNALGTCSIPVPGTTDSESAVYYSEGGLTADEAQMACVSISGATWTPA